MAGAPGLGKPLAELEPLLAEHKLSCLAVRRQNQSLIAQDDLILEAEDELYFMCARDQAGQALALFGHEEAEGRRVLIVGGGTIGLELAKRLERDHAQVRVKLIDKDRAVAEHAAEELDKTTVLHGDALNFELLEEAGVGHVETMVAVSNDDQVNILGALLAKQHGAERAVALVNSPNYGLLTGRLGMDAVVNPRGITVSTVLSFVRSGSVVEINSILDGFGEVLEFQVHATSTAAGQALGDLKLPEGVVIGALIRADGSFERGANDSRIAVKDRVVLFVPAQHIAKVEKTFAVSVSFL